MKLPRILPQPKRPSLLANTSKWLAGEGAGSWFVFEETANNIQIKRYSPKGVLECENLFEKPRTFSTLDEFEISYPSHCAVVTVIQNGEKVQFSVLENAI